MHTRSKAYEESLPEVEELSFRMSELFSLALHEGMIFFLTRTCAHGVEEWTIWLPLGFQPLPNSVRFVHFCYSVFSETPSLPASTVWVSSSQSLSWLTWKVSYPNPTLQSLLALKDSSSSIILEPRITAPTTSLWTSLTVLPSSPVGEAASLLRQKNIRNRATQIVSSYMVGLCGC